MSDGHRTSTIPRPAATATTGRGAVQPTMVFDDQLVDDQLHDDQLDDDRLLKEFTSPIPRGKEIVTKGHGKLIVGVFATLIAVAIGAALFVLPVKSWMKQRDTLQTRIGELETLNGANDQLQQEVDRLQTDDGIREAAREGIDYVPDGEERITVLPVGPASTVLPNGWPYNLVTSIIALRQEEAAAALAAAAAAPTSTG